jgi:hypothetical protein
MKQKTLCKFFTSPERFHFLKLVLSPIYLKPELYQMGPEAKAPVVRVKYRKDTGMKQFVRLAPGRYPSWGWGWGRYVARLVML